MKFKNFVLGVGIFIVFALALFQGLETFYPTPQYDDFCTGHPGPIIYKEPTQCSNIPGLQNRASQCWDSKGEFFYTYDSNGCPIDGVCDDCRIDYENALDKHSTKIFIISIVIGILVFVAGLFNIINLSSEELEIAHPWMNTGIEFHRVLDHCNKFLAIFSNDDPYVHADEAEKFKKNLGAKIIIKKGQGHFNETEKIPEILNFL